MISTLLQASSPQTLTHPVVHRVSNGLTIVAEQMPVEAVSLNLWLNVGSAIEADEINGMAHFLEHMVFKGTPRLAHGEFERRVEDRGAITNAATSQDYTHFYITTAPQDFADLAPLLVDVVTNPSIPDDGFERERQVVLEEIRRSQDNPRRRTFHHAVQVSFDRLPYRRQVLGPSSVIEQLLPQQMREFHGTWYNPQSITAVAVGNQPVDQLIRVVEHSFAQVKTDRTPPSADSLDSSLLSLPAIAPLLSETPFQEIVRRDVVDPSLQQARLIMVWRVPGLSDLHETYPLDMLASILGHGRTSRLVQQLREQRGLVSSISASNTTYQHQGAFYISAHLPAENVAAVEAAIVEQLSMIQQKRVSIAEIERVKTRVANHYIYGNETPGDRSGIYGYYQALVGDVAAALHYPDWIRGLTAEDLQQSAQRYLAPDAYGVVIVRPDPK